MVLRFVKSKTMTNPDQSHEQHVADVIQHTDVFTQSLDVMTKMQGDARFQQACMDSGVDPFDEGDPAYWQVYETFAQDRIQQLQEKAGHTELLDTLTLMSKTPHFIHNQLRLDQLRSMGFPNLTPDQKAEWRTAKQVVSVFGSEIRDYALRNHAVQAETLSVGLQKILPYSVEPGSQVIAKQNIEQTIRGAQHELAFGQILSFADMKSRAATVEEDKKGIDFVVNEGLPTEMFLDVKASLSEIEAQGGINKAYARKPGNKLVIFSLVKDSELHGGFFLDEAAATEKARALEVLLTEARQAA